MHVLAFLLFPRFVPASCLAFLREEKYTFCTRRRRVEGAQGQLEGCLDMEGMRRGGVRLHLGTARHGAQRRVSEIFEDGGEIHPTDAVGCVCSY